MMSIRWRSMLCRPMNTNNAPTAYWHGRRTRNLDASTPMPLALRSRRSRATSARLTNEVSVIVTPVLHVLSSLPTPADRAAPFRFSDIQSPLRHFNAQHRARYWNNGYHTISSMQTQLDHCILCCLRSSVGHSPDQCIQ